MASVVRPQHMVSSAIGILTKKDPVPADVFSEPAVGVVCFTAGVIPLLIGLTNQSEIDSSTLQTYRWTDANVVGPLVAGVVLLLLFTIVESRAKHSIVPLDLFKIRNYALSLAMTFLVGMGYVGVIFMPRFFQTVHHISATWSGYCILPALLGMMAGAIVGGVLISAWALVP